MDQSINFASQRISFVNKISLLQKALSNDETPTPAFLYKDINDISYESPGYCESLVEFLVDRLGHQSYYVKVKVLKVMKHVLENGSKEFQLGLRHHVSLVKACTKFSGPPHPVVGNTPYVMVRNIAVELSEALYDLDPVSLTGRSLGEVRPPPAKYAGMGPSSRPGGDGQGFGNTPTAQSRGLAGTILQEIERLGNKLSVETPGQRQEAVLARLNLSGSSSHYQPPAVPLVVPPQAIHITEEARDSLVTTDKVGPRRLPGKAGGGWNDEDLEDTGGGGGADTQVSLQESQESGEDISPRSEPQDMVDDMTIRAPDSSTCSIGYLTHQALGLFLQRCSTMRCAAVIDRICENLVKKDPLWMSRSLQLLESLVSSPHQLLPIDLLASTCRSALLDSFLGASREAAVHQRQTGQWRSAQMKAAKLILILHQLSSHKDILPTSQIASQLANTPLEASPVF